MVARSRAVPTAIFSHRRRSILRSTVMAEENLPPAPNPEVRVSSGFGKIVVTLGQLPPKTLLDERAVAEMLSVTMRTIRRMVARNELPPPVMFAGKATWIAGRILEHIEARADRAAQHARKEALRIEALFMCAPGEKIFSMNEGISRR